MSETALDATVQPIESTNPNGEFQLILSKDNLDRDGEHLWADEWKDLPAKVHMDSDHAFSKGQSVPLTVGSGVPEINEDGDLVVKGSYAGTEHGQLVRQLVKEGHVWQASVAYSETKDADGNILRELLNGTITGVPSNPEAVITSSKDKKPYGNVRYADTANSKYPIDTEEHVRAALSYFGQAKNRSEYTAAQQSTILGRIRSAARRFGIQLSDDSTKALAWALCKAVALGAGQDIGASSVYDADQSDDPGEDDESDEPDDLAQAVHDAACALGAACSKSVTTDVLPPAADEAAGVATDKVPTQPVVSPADLAARAREVRKFTFDQSLMTNEA